MRLLLELDCIGLQLPASNPRSKGDAVAAEPRSEGRCGRRRKRGCRPRRPHAMICKQGPLQVKEDAAPARARPHRAPNPRIGAEVGGVSHDRGRSRSHRGDPRSWAEPRLEGSGCAVSLHVPCLVDRSAAGEADGGAERGAPVQVRREMVCLRVVLDWTHKIRPQGTTDARWYPAHVGGFFIFLNMLLLANLA
jgi:hypothetical protein